MSFVVAVGFHPCLLVMIYGLAFEVSMVTPILEVSYILNVASLVCVFVCVLLGIIIESYEIVVPKLLKVMVSLIFAGNNAGVVSFVFTPLLYLSIVFWGFLPQQKGFLP